MYRSTFFVLLGLVLSSSAFADRPNVILVMCDDLGYGDPQSFNPNSPILTPHIDAMVADGLKFNRFYSAAPVCSPTRGSCLTGRHPYRYGIYSANTGHMKDQEITLPELLQQQGYTTGHFGKWHMGTLTTTVEDANRGGPRGAKNFSPPSRHGYDVSFVTESKVPTFDPMIMPRGAKAGGNWDAILDKSDAVAYGTSYWDNDGKEVTENLEGDDSRVIMDRAIPFIEQAATDRKPFFAAVWFHAPHLPCVAGPDHVKHYADQDVAHRNYYGCVTALDEQLGRLRAKLKQLDIADNTMLWFCSDNGPEGKNAKSPGSAGHFRGRKRSLYEGGVRVPGVLVWPGQTSPGTSTDFPAVTSDYLPTVLDALDLPSPEKRPIDGVSLIDAIKDSNARRATGIGFQSSSQVAWHRGQYKLISTDRGKTWELYDLSNDPAEKSDLAREDAARVAAMKAEVIAWQKSCKWSDGGQDY